MITLEEFIEKEKASLLAFEEMWRKEMSVNSEDFPPNLSHADWFEQFVVWTDDIERTTEKKI